METEPKEMKQWNNFWTFFQARSTQMMTISTRIKNWKEIRLGEFEIGCRPYYIVVNWSFTQRDFMRISTVA